MISRALITTVAGCLITIVAGCAMGYSYGWWKGFYQGADTVLCVQSYEQLSKEDAQKTRSCEHISDKNPPLDLFFQQED